MGLFRLLLLVALIATAFWLWRRVTAKRPTRETEQTIRPMVRCACCGVHVPRAQALQADNQWYCSRAHLEQGSKPGGH